jgi:thymidylate synthase
MDFDFPANHYEFPELYRTLRGLLLFRAETVDVGEWHAMDVSEKKELVSHELHSLTFHTPMPQTQESAVELYEPNMPWAENQFQERVSGEPLNPGETYKQWPWQSKMDEHVDKVFSHTYMERYWPRFANRRTWKASEPKRGHLGIRYRYGDLNDVVDLLARSPLTRQAILPVWFPEDTGAVHQQRVPCSLSYQFLLREGRLHCIYNIRSCDFVRHFRDDVYLTVRLVQWLLSQLGNKQGNETVYTPSQLEPNWDKVTPGTLTMHIGSLHIFEGDRSKLEREVEKSVRSSHKG